MISATAAACGSSGADRLVNSSPSAARFSDALNVAIRNPPAGASLAPGATEPSWAGASLAPGAAEPSAAAVVSVPGAVDSPGGSVVARPGADVAIRAARRT